MKRHFWKMPKPSLQGNASSPPEGIFIWAVCTVLGCASTPHAHRLRAPLQSSWQDSTPIQYLIHLAFDFAHAFMYNPHVVQIRI